MELGLIILFLVVGLIFLLVEILITPGFILGAIGIGFMTFGIMKSYSSYGSEVGNIVLVSVFVVTIIIVLLALKGGVWKRMASQDTIASKANVTVEDVAQIGDRGKTLSALRPSGNAILNGHKVEVHSMGEPIAAGIDIEVMRLTGNKIIVRQIENS